MACKLLARADTLQTCLAANCAAQVCRIDVVTQPTNGQWGIVCSGAQGMTIADGAFCDLTCDDGYQLSDQPQCDATGWEYGPLTTATATCTADSCGLPQAGCASSGTSCIDVGGVQVLECDAVGPGFFFNAGLGGSAPTVAACPAGTYSADRLGTTNTWQLVSTSDATAVGHICIGCGPGTYVEDTGSDEVADCLDCVAGTYAPDDNDDNAANPCTICPADSTTASARSTNVQDCLCDPGFEGTLTTDADTCTACVAGFTKLAPGTGPCVECPAGSADEDADATTDCTPCAAGLYSAAGATSCTACAAGTFDHDSNSATECQDCAAGTYSPTSGQLSCLECPQNSGTGETTGASAVSACLCDMGYTGSLVGPSSTCTACEAGTYIDSVGGEDQTACIACETGRQSETASTDVTACLDVDECSSDPCQNGAACSDSTSDPLLPLGGYRCACADGYASGTCTYDEIVSDYTAACAIGLSTDAVEIGQGNCAVDVDECSSTPCQNGAECHEHLSAWECQCATVINAITGERTSHHGEQCEIETNPCALDEDDCDPINADCEHTGPGQHTCTCHLGWTGDGSSCIDVDECSSEPCQNGGFCTESACDQSVAPTGTACNAGANTCVTTVVDACVAAAGTDEATCASAGACTWTPCDANSGAGCVDLCTTTVIVACAVANADEATCLAAGACTFAPADDRPPLDSYRCACAAGFAGGMCAAGWDSDSELAEFYDANCQLGTGGLCNIDMDECISSPCENSAQCSESNADEDVPVSAHAYRCKCGAGYANGACDYLFIDAYATECSVQESSASETLSGNCNVDVNECASSPCENDAMCEDSTSATCDLDDGTDGTAECPEACISSPGVEAVVAVSPQDAVCTGVPTNVLDGSYDPETGQVTCFDSSCSPNGCPNCPHGCTITAGVPEVVGIDYVAPTCTSAAPIVSVHAYRCTCQEGYASGTCHYDFITEYTAECSVEESSSSETLGGNCDLDVDDCVSSPCQNNAACSESSVLDTVMPHAYQCTCEPGFANGLCDYAFISEYETECSVGESTAGVGPMCGAIYTSDCAAIGSAGAVIGEDCNVDARCTFHDGGNDDDSDDECVATDFVTCLLETGNGEEACSAAGNCTYTAGLGGNCDIDVDECASSPCENGAVCTESSVDSTIGFSAYRCSCPAGYANGACEYSFIEEYTAACTVAESSASQTLSGNCDIDVDECASAPCQNNATCTESAVEDAVSTHAYQCTCMAGFANGVCEYPFIAEYADECAVLESSANGTLSGNCDIDVDECTSGPCQNNGVCSDSTNNQEIAVSDYTCLCAPGFTNGQCEPDNGCTTLCFEPYDEQCLVPIPTSTSEGNCDTDVDECASAPCQHGGICANGPGDFSCTCSDYSLGWDGLPAVITPAWLEAQAGVSSTWSTDTDCEVREYTDYRCEPGQEVNSTENLRRGGQTDTYNCVNCEPGTYSPDGLRCEVCAPPDVIIPVDWWCRRRVSVDGTVLEEAGPCQRNLACTRCPTGLVPNNISTGCVEPDLGGSTDDGTDSASSTVAAVVPTAQVQLRVSETVFTDPQLEAQLTEYLIQKFAVAMNLDPVDVVVEGLSPVEDNNGRRHLQDEAFRAPDGGGTTVAVLFTVRPGAGAGALYALDEALQDNSHPTTSYLRDAGLAPVSFAVDARCPAGKTRNGEDITCYKCPFPAYTPDRETCIKCPEGQVPTDKGDGCRCGEGFYNQTSGHVNCFSLYEQYDVKWDTADKSEQFDSLPDDECSPCPQGGGPNSCVTCADGIVRISPGYALGDPDQQDLGLPIDAIPGPRPVFECLIKSQCLGDAGPNLALPTDHAPLTYVTWENDFKCAEAHLNGQESTCTSRGACKYTPGILAAPAVDESPESCTEPADGSGPGDCAASFSAAVTSGLTFGADNCRAGCNYAAATSASQATTFRAETCIGITPNIDRWCGKGYQGPLCSNCISEYSRGGIKRTSPCRECPEGVPTWAWVALLVTMVVLGIAVEFVLGQRGEDEEEDDDMRPMADRAVALVIGNGSYDIWPNVDEAPNGSNRVAQALSGYGYRVIHCNNPGRETFEKAVAQYRTAVGEMAALSVNAKRVKACGVQEDSSLEDKLLKELTDLNLKDLRARAMDDGASAIELEHLLEDEDPKHATITFCLERELAKIPQALDAGEQDLPAKPWSRAEQKQLEIAWTDYTTEDAQISWDVAEGKKRDTDWQDHRDAKYEFLASMIPTRDAEEVKARVKRVGKAQITNPPGMNDGEVACMFYYCGHGCQIEGKNFLVPTDANLNPTSENLISVEDVLHARCGDKETQERIGETVSGPSIVVLDAARWVAPGSLDKEHRDTFQCPIQKTVMVEPVYLMGEPTGWRYEKRAVDMYLDGMQEKNADYRSPMSAKKLFLPNTIPPQLTRKTVLDTTLQHRIRKYTERSTLNQMEPVVENTILVFSARPNMYADPSGALFTKELLELMDGNDAVGMLFTKASIRSLRASEGKQVCWDFNAMTQIGTFCISGKEPILSAQDDDAPNPEDEEVLSILQQSKDQAKKSSGSRSSSNMAGPSISRGACGKPKQLFKSVGNQLGKIKPALKTFVGMTQVLGGMSFAFNIEWPDFFNQVVEYSKALSIDFASILPIGCFRGSWTFTGNFYMQIGYPPIVLLIMLIVYKTRRSSLRVQVDPPDKEIQMEHEMLLSSSLSHCFTFVFMIYPAVSQTIFQALISQDLSDDTELLRVDFQIDFGSPTHQMIIFVAVFMVLVYPLGFPVAIVYTLWSNRDGLMIPDSPERKQFDPLVADYKLDCYYWEALEMFRKVLLTGIMIFFVPGSVFQLVFGVLISTVFLCLSVSIRPYLSRFNNRFKIVTDIAVLTTFAIAIMMNKSVDTSQEPRWLDKSVFDVAFSVVNVILPALAVFAELITQATSGEEAEEIHEYAWLGDEKHGGFKELVLDESPRLKELRYNLEDTNLQTLNLKASDAGISSADIQAMHSAPNPKHDIIEALVQIAGTEGSGSVGKNGPKRKPIGTVAGVFGFVDQSNSMVRKMNAESEFANPVLEPDPGDAL